MITMIRDDNCENQKKNKYIEKEKSNKETIDNKDLLKVDNITTNIIYVQN